MKILIFTIYFVFGVTYAMDFPSYLPRCSLTADDLNGCIKENGNIAIPLIAKGDEALGIPVMDPVHIPEGQLVGENLVINVKDTVSNDFKDARLTDVLFNLEGRRSEFTLGMDTFNVLGEYSITDGKILSHTVSGSGKINMTLIGVTLKFQSDIGLNEKDGENYMEFLNPSIKMLIKRGHYVFGDLQSSENGVDINAVIDENWEVLNAETTPSLEFYFNLIIMGALNPIANAFPVTTIFLP